MKKGVCMLLALALCLGAVGASAQGRLVVREETYTAVELFEDSMYGYVFAQLENAGETDAYFDKAELTILDASGGTMAERTAFTCYPNVVAPGERAYFFAYSAADAAKSPEEIAGHRLNVWSNEAIEARPVALTVTEAVYASETDLFGEPIDKVYVTAKNETDAPLFTPSVAFALYGAAGELLYIDAMTQFDMGVPAGQSFIMTFTIDDAFRATWEAQGVVPTRVEAIAIVQY